MAEIVITAVGPDRPGLVGELTGLLYAAKLNIADSRMVNLRGQFAVVLLAEGPDEAMEKLRAELPRAAGAIGLTVSFNGAAAPTRAAAGVPFKLKSYSADQPGLVHRVTSLLRNHGANIEELETRLESAPFSGEPIFTLELVMKVPRETRVKALKGDLDALADSLNCDFDLEPV